MLVMLDEEMSPKKQKMEAVITKGASDLVSIMVPRLHLFLVSLCLIKSNNEIILNQIIN